jgi:hypothetical protein
MLVTSPVSWPISKILDWALGSHKIVRTRAAMPVPFAEFYRLRLVLRAACAVTMQLSTGMPSQAIMRRRQLKTLVEIHSQQEGLGGNLTDDEIMVMQARAIVSTRVSVM